MNSFKPEPIVKRDIPLTGTYEKRGIDHKNRILIPKPIRTELRLRQNQKEEDCILYLRKREYPLLATLTDNPQSRFQDYYLIKMDSQGRILLGRVEIPKDKKVDLFGIGNSIEIVVSNLDL